MGTLKNSQKVDPQEVYSYLKSKGLSDHHAAGILTNIEAESGFNASAVGDNGTSVGLFQHHASRAENLKKFAGNDWKNWKKQVDFALQEAPTQKYLQNSFKTPEEASKWWTVKWEAPSNKHEKANQRAGNVKKYLYSSGTQDEAPPAKTLFLESTPGNFTEFPMEDIEKEINKVQMIEQNLDKSSARQEIETKKQERLNLFLDLGLKANSINVYKTKKQEEQEAEAPAQGYDIAQIELQTELPSLPNIFQVAQESEEDIPQYANGGEVPENRLKPLTPEQAIGQEPIYRSEAQKFLADWYQKRQIPDDYLNEGFNLDRDAYKNRTDNFPQVNFKDKIEDGSQTGVFQTDGRFNMVTGEVEVLKSAKPSTETHELNHYINSGGVGEFVRTGNKAVVENELKNQEQLSNSSFPDNLKNGYKNERDYFADPDEIHSRVMVLRQKAGIKPDQFVTQEFLENFLKTYKGEEGNINDLLHLSKDKEALLNLLNYMASNSDTRSSNQA